LTILPSATRTGTTTSPDFTNYNNRGIILWLIITARTVGVSPLIRIAIENKDPITGYYVSSLYSSTFDPATGQYIFVCYPGLKEDETPTWRKFYNNTLGRIFRVKLAFEQDVTNLTYSIGAVLLR